jgi:hypothetical protein
MLEMLWDKVGKKGSIPVSDAANVSKAKKALRISGENQSGDEGRQVFLSNLCQVSATTTSKGKRPDHKV